MRKSDLQHKPWARVAIRKIDYLAMIFAWLYFLVNLFALDHIIRPEEVFPFTVYYSNIGIRLVVISQIIVAGALSIAFIWFAVKRELSAVAFNVMLLGCIFLSAIGWFELWWGSTFYYGEVRDKQGLTFPLGCALWLAYVAFGVKMPLWLDRPPWRVIFAVVLFLLQWLLWQLVYEPWNLYQS